MNTNHHVIAGTAAIIQAVLYVFGFVLLLGFLQPIMAGASSPEEKLSLLLENKGLYEVWLICIYVVFGIVLVPLTIALHERFSGISSLAVKAAPVFGFIWSGLVIASGMIAVVGMGSVATLYAKDPQQAYTVWRILDAVQNGLGGGVEVIGGLWVLLISANGLTYRKLPKLLHFFGLLVGTTGLVTLIPALKEAGALFGLTQIVWFLGVGTALFKNN